MRLRSRASGALLGLAVMAGCGRPAPAARTFALTDDAGVVTDFARPAGRVVSLVPAGTELLYALGGGPLLVGRTRWCDYPAEALAVPSVGDGLSPNVEAVIARRPDLVLLYRSATNAQAASRLRGLGVAVLEIAIDRQQDFERDARLLARAIGRPGAGDSLVAAVAARLTAATATGTGGPSVLALAWTDPPIAIGGGSFLDEIIRRAGARNLFGDQPQPSFVVSIEAVVARKPDLILAVGDEEPAFVRRPEWRAVAAVRDRRFVRVAGSMFNRPSPRIADAVLALRSALDSARTR